VDEIVKAMAAEFEPLGFEDRYFYRRMGRAMHGSSLRISTRRGKRRGGSGPAKLGTYAV
jgi:hypothetical protein